jgi:hypothetical protein
MPSKSSIFFIKILLVLVGLAAIIISGWYLIQSINKNIQQVINPLSQANQSLSTQVSGLLHPTPTIIADPITIIYKVRSLARLETIQYSVEKVITAEVNQGVLGPLVGDKLLFVAHGVVIAGIDMSKLGPEDMQLVNGTLTVRLPKAEIFMATLDNKKSYVYDRSTGLLSQGTTDLETKARQVAEDEIKKAALQDGILDQATQNAEVFMERMFNQLGYDKVIFSPPES